MSKGGAGSGSQASGSGSGSPAAGSGSLASLPMPSWWDTERKRTVDKWNAARKRTQERAARVTDVAQAWTVWNDMVRDGQQFSRELQRQQDAAAFQPGPGLQMGGDPADQETFLELVRREMARSQSFHDLMMAINQGASSPIHVEVWPQNTNQVVDSFVGRGVHGIDLVDLQKFPVDPPSSHPEAVTQGEFLAHAMGEARRGTNLYMSRDRAYPLAHADGIRAGNAYRADRDQHATRTATDTNDGRQVGVTYESNGRVVYREAYDYDGAGNVTKITRQNVP